MATNDTQKAHSAKKRVAISYDNMSPELLAAFKEKYPRGYADYLGDIFKVEKPNGTFFYAVYLELSDAIYLVKIDVDIDENTDDELFDDEQDNVDDDVFPDEGSDMEDENDSMDD